MVGPPDVDEPVEAALELVLVVSDVAGQIARPAVLADEHLVLLVAQVGRAKPERAIGFVAPARLIEGLKGVAHLVLFVERALHEPGIELHAKGEHVALVAGHDLAKRIVIESGQSLLMRHLQIAVALGSDQLRSHVDNVLALVSILRDSRLFPKLLEVTRVQRLGESLHLGAVHGVVDVVLPRDLPAGALQEVGERVADGGRAPLHDSERPCRVGAHELQKNALAFA